MSVLMFKESLQFTFVGGADNLRYLEEAFSEPFQLSETDSMISQFHSKLLAFEVG